MYKSAHLFLQRLPATRFWQDYAPVHHLKLVNSDEVLLDALADAVGKRNSKITMEQFSDYELSGLLVVISNMGLTKGIPLKIADGIDRRVQNESQEITLSIGERVGIAAAIKEAATNWRKSK